MYNEITKKKQRKRGELGERVRKRKKKENLFTCKIDNIFIDRLTSMKSKKDSN